MKSGDFQVDLVVNGRKIREYEHLGQNFVEGRFGSEYRIRIRNFSDARVLAVTSVDGLSVLTGKPASLRDNGYIIPAKDKLEIIGWRKDDAEVAAFQFGSHAEAYAAQVGNKDDVGAIMVAIFEEASIPDQIGFPPLPRFDPVHRSRFMPRPPFCREPSFRSPWGDHRLIGASGTTHSYSAETRVRASLKGATPRLDQEPTSPTGVNNLGTVYGETREHKITRVVFNPRENYTCLFQINYDTRAGLRRRGVVLTRKAEIGQVETEEIGV